MTDIVKGMIAAQRTHAIDGLREGALVTGESKQRAALMWLADNVSDEMSNAAKNNNGGYVYRTAIAAAIRAAAGEEGK